MANAHDKPVDKPSGGFRLGRVLMVVIPIVLIVVGGATAYVFVPDYFTSFFRPPLVAVKGEVYWNGKKLDGGMVSTQPENPKLEGASGFINADGTFELDTLTAVDLKKGAYAGVHKVTVAQNQRVSQGPAQPPLLTPEPYASFDTTPLKIEVSRDPDDNVVRIELTGEGPPKLQPRVQQAGTPTERAQKMVEQFDEDKDGKLSDVEGRRTPISFGIRNADTNKDGFYDLDEMIVLLGGTPEPKPTEGTNPTEGENQPEEPAPPDGTDDDATSDEKPADEEN